jgi:stress-induced morphogen
MANEKLKQMIREVFTGGYFHDRDDLVDLSDGPDDSIHVVIVSRKFDGKHMKEKHDLIWSELIQKLPPDVWGKVSLSIGVSPEELKAT